jgi:hypothetical protein
MSCLQRYLSSCSHPQLQRVSDREKSVDLTTTGGTHEQCKEETLNSVVVYLYCIQQPPEQLLKEHHRPLWLQHMHLSKMDVMQLPGINSCHQLLLCVDESVDILTSLPAAELVRKLRVIEGGLGFLILLLACYGHKTMVNLTSLRLSDASDIFQCDIISYVYCRCLKLSALMAFHASPSCSWQSVWTASSFTQHGSNLSWQQQAAAGPL